MALINRVSRLFKADLHAVLDQMEEPALLLKQAIRDMEDELLATEQCIADCAYEQSVLTDRTAELKSALTDLDGELDLCFESEKEHLARATIRKKLTTERLMKRVESKYSSNETYLLEQRALLDEKRVTAEGLRQKAELLTDHSIQHRDTACDFADLASMTRETSVRNEEVEIAYLREKGLRGES